MKLIGVCRIGRDAEIRYSANGKPVANFSAAYDYGKKGDDGKRPTQWIDCAIWGDRAENLAPYLLKGQQVMVVGDAHIETFARRDGGEGSKIVVMVNDLTLCGGRPEASGGADAPRSSSAPAARPPQPSAQIDRPQSKFGDFEDDIPF